MSDPLGSDEPMHGRGSDGRPAGRFGASLRAVSQSSRTGAAIGIALLAVGIGWVLYQALSKGLGSTGNLPSFILISLTAMSLAGLYFLASSGLTLIFGLMRVVNMAHGSLYLLGGYLAWVMITQLDVGWYVAAAVATALIALVGLAMEQIFLRWNLGQDLRQALITIAIALLLADLMLAWFGGMAQTIPAPEPFDGRVDLGVYGLAFSSFRLFIIAAAVVVGVLLYLWIHKTRFGMVVRAGIDDGPMTSALGVNVRVVFATVFLVGSGLAGLAGVLGGTVLSLAPGQDQVFLTSSIVIVIVGGMGSLTGAAVGAVLLAFVQTYAAVYLPSGWGPYAMMLTFILVAAVLALKPSGLFGRSTA